MAKKSKETKDNQIAKRFEDQVDTIKSLTQKLEAFKLSHSTLVNKYDVLLNKVACATNPSTCVAFLEQEKKVLNESLKSSLASIWLCKHVTKSLNALMKCL
jgi:exonuclease VII small subunit